MDTVDIEVAATKQCIKCEALIEMNCKFCSACGTKQYAAETVDTHGSWELAKQAAVFYAIYIIICALSNFVDYFHTFSWMLVIEAVMAVTSVAFFAFNWVENKHLLRWESFGWQKLAAYAAIAMTGAVLVHYSVGWLNVTIFSKREEHYFLLRGSFYFDFILVFFTAITPALFEELAFRGYLLQVMRKIGDTEQAVYISAFLFAIIHLSFLSLFWLIPFALFIGYMRIRENTLWYGIFFHFFFNLTACLFQLL